MVWLYPLFTRVEVEIPVDPHSGFWYYHQEIDEDDPLTLLIKCEEGDEEALELMRHQQGPRGL